jgi:hypothetical protein
MSPVLITTPRTGSSLMVRQLFNIAKHYWGCQSLLYEYFNINPNYRVITKTIDNILYYDRTARSVSENQSIDKNQEIVNRIKILTASPSNTYLFKIHAADISDSVYDFLIEKKYNIVYLHRHNKLEQLLSFLSAFDNNVWLHRNRDTEIKKFKYNKKVLEIFLNHLDKFFEIRNKLPGVDIYYEDYVELGSNENAIMQLLEIKSSQPIDLQNYNIIPTPYSDHNKELLIVNYQQWCQDRSSVIEQLNKYQ